MIATQLIGNTIVEWDEKEPLSWSMSETQAEEKHYAEAKIKVNLSPLLKGYEQNFLTSLKKVIIERRLRVSLKSIKTETKAIIRLLTSCHEHFSKVCNEHKIPYEPIKTVNIDFLAGLTQIQNNIPQIYLSFFKQLYETNKDNKDLFAPDIHPGDVPIGGRDEGAVERFRKSVLSSALSRSSIAHTLNATESAYETGQLDLGRFAFSRLMLSRAARPETYRLLRCKDLQIDTIDGIKTYFIRLTIPKTRTATPPKVNLKIHPDIGLLLEKQREAVVNRLKHLVIEKNNQIIKGGGGSATYTNGDLPLFPTPGRMSLKTKESLGMVGKSEHFVHFYVDPLKDISGRNITCTAIRHTIATHLAMAGCTSTTIAAVLLHSTTFSAKIYVDLIFDGAIDKLSDSLEPAFTEHYPIFEEFSNSSFPIPAEKRVVSVSSDRLHRKTTGECGRSQACQYAPLACYECHHFKPCYDVDHTINLDRVDAEIRFAQEAGHQRQADVKRYKHLANIIRTVITACNEKRMSIDLERANDTRHVAQ